MAKTKTPRKEKAQKAPKPVKVPVSAKLIFNYYDPRKEQRMATLQVRATKARFYVWQNGEWSIRTAEEARAAISAAEASMKSWRDNAAKMAKVQAFVEHARETQDKWAAEANISAQIANIEEAHIRLYTKASSLDERMKINDEKEALINQIYDSVYEDEDMPEIPEAWLIISANPSKYQYSLRF